MSARNLANEQTIALDPFCGTGNNIIHLSLVFDHVYGGDINHDTLKQAHNNVLRSGAKAHLYNRNFFEADYYLKVSLINFILTIENVHIEQLFLYINKYS